MSNEDGGVFAAEVIEQLKERFQVATDNELAQLLGIGRSTITSWRRRDSVPDRFAKMLEVSGPLAFSNGLPYEHWGDVDKAAIQLALLRLIRSTAAECTNLEVTMKIGHELPTLLTTMFKDARQDVLKGVAHGVKHPDFAVYTLIGHEFFDYD